MINVQSGTGSSECGPGVEVTLSPSDVYKAIQAYLVSHDVNIFGPRTHIDLQSVCIYVDPSGYVISNNIKFNGNGEVQ